MLFLGLVSSIPALGGSRGLRCESCSAQNLMHSFCPYYKLFLLLCLSCTWGKSKDCFQCSETEKCCSGLLVREICCLLAWSLWKRIFRG